MSDEFKIYASLGDGQLQAVLSYKGDYRDISPEMADYITLLQKKVKWLDIIMEEDTIQGKDENRSDGYMYDILYYTREELYKEQEDE